MRLRIFPLACFFLLLAAVAVSQAPAQAPAGGAEEPKEGFRAEYVGDVRDLERKIVGLAESLPQDKMTYRPGEGLRSMSEVLLHIATANYTFPRIAGAAPPAGIDLRGMPSSTTEKAKIAEMLRASFAHSRQAILAMTDADMDQLAPNSKWTRRRALVFQLRHASEHMGQLIAYARINGIVPPWTEETQRRQQQPAKQQ